MRREARDRKPYIKPVIKAELSEDHFWGRFIIVLLLITVAVFFISRGVLSLVNGETGVREIACRDSETNLSGDLKFKYNIGEAGISASVEYKQLVALYTDACTEAYGFFVKELDTINSNPNTAITVSPELYNVLQEFDSSVFMYLEPIYEQYRNLFACLYDYEAENFDPYFNSDLAQYYKEICKFANSGDIKLKLLDNNSVCLYISDAYLSYARQNEISDYISFGPAFEAVVVDYVSSKIKAKGYSNGILASYDGFAASLDGKNTVYFYNEVSERSCYVYSDKTVRTRYISTENGLCKAFESDFVKTTDASCVETYLLNSK